MSAGEMQITLPVDLFARMVGVLERLESSLPAGKSPEELLTTEEVAERLGGKSTRYVQRLVRQGLLKKVPDLGKRTTRFRPAAVEMLLAGGKENRPGRRRL